MVYSRSHYYVGEFSNDLKCGNGMEVYENGDRYKGDWKDDL